VEKRAEEDTVVMQRTLLLSIPVLRASRFFPPALEEGATVATRLQQDYPMRHTKSPPVKASG